MKNRFTPLKQIGRRREVSERKDRCVLREFY